MERLLFIAVFASKYKNKNKLHNITVCISYSVLLFVVRNKEMAIKIIHGCVLLVTTEIGFFKTI